MVLTRLTTDSTVLGLPGAATKRGAHAPKQSTTTVPTARGVEVEVEVGVRGEGVRMYVAPGAVAAASAKMTAAREKKKTIGTTVRRA